MKRCWFCRTNKNVNYTGKIRNACPWAENAYITILVCEKCKESHELDLKEYWDSKMADMQASQDSKWTYVKDSLPEPNITVLCSDYRSDIYTGWLDTDGTWYRYDGEEMTEVIQWMTIPN